MARREIIVFTDDVTGEETSDVQTVLLVADGIAYEIDMAPATREAYAAAIEPFRSAGRRIGRASGNGASVLRPAFNGAPAASSRTVPDKEQNRAVREWWGRNAGRDGLPELTERGRIPQPVLDAFQRHGGRTIEAAPDVQAGKQPRKAGTVGAEMSVTAKSADKPVSAPPAAQFSEAQPASKPADTPRKTVPAKTPRKRTNAAKVTTDGSKSSNATKRTGRRAAAS